LLRRSLALGTSRRVEGILYLTALLLPVSGSPPFRSVEYWDAVALIGTVSEESAAEFGFKQAEKKGAVALVKAVDSYKGRPLGRVSTGKRKTVACRRQTGWAGLLNSKDAKLAP
jgi:hypothetical protein